MLQLVKTHLTREDTETADLKDAWSDLVNRLTVRIGVSNSANPLLLIIKPDIGGYRPSRVFETQEGGPVCQATVLFPNALPGHYV